MWRLSWTLALLCCCGGQAASQDIEQAAFIEQLFVENARDYAKLDTAKLYANDDDLVWVNDPKQWHQQLARIVDHHFSSFDELVTAAKDAKQAGVSALMLVKPQKTSACPGGWYGGLQLCDHINGSFPAADGTLEKWKSMLQEIKPMRFMWWANMDYWSVQGQVWAEAKASHDSGAGKWFSWGAQSKDNCWGSNPDGAQGSWGSSGQWSGYQSALASWGSEAYADYLADAMANSWTKNLGIDGYCIDCVTCYQRGNSNCVSGMLQTNGDAMAAWGKIVEKVRQKQPHVAMSAETYFSWKDVITSNSDIGGQGFGSYHDKMQQAVWNGDASNLEDIASTSGADAATVLCYLNPFYDGRQPGACPTMYFRDTTGTMKDVKQYRMWVALEAASGIVPQHDATGGSFWNPPNDPFDSTESPLWAFTKYRALNRLALRTKLSVSGSKGALAYLKHDSMGPRGDAALMVFNPGAAGKVTIDLSMLPASVFGVVPYDLLDKHSRSDGHVSDPNVQGICDSVHGLQCWGDDIKNIGKVSTHQECCNACEALAGCKAWTWNFNIGGDCYLKTACSDRRNNSDCHSGLASSPAPTPPTPPGPVPALAKSWTVDMGAGEMKLFSGFTLGVFAPRKGKKTNCKADDQYSKKATGATLQACFLECLGDSQCENVQVDYIDIKWMEKPADVSCTLLGALKDPSNSCEQGTGTLIKKLPGARSCAHLWTGETPPLAPGAPAVLPGPLTSKCTSANEPHTETNGAGILI